MLDPRSWKREHQIALVSAIVLGFFVGVLVGVYLVTSYNPYAYYSWTFWWLLGGTFGYLLRVASWGVVGSLIAAALVYVRQLLRA